ncbi:MAG: PEP-utilizing enzyme [Syntrophobacteraceae bacterium]|jgi:pyruvate,water dikinase|nr:PEP-utilizing enzyme [Syntrophobacteraceae bacterium]
MPLFNFFKRKNVCTLLTQVDGPMVEKYRRFREFLCLNRDALNLMAEIEETFYGGSPFSMGTVRGKVRMLTETTFKLAETLNGVSRGRYRALTGVCEAIGREVQAVLAAPPSDASGALVLALEAVAPSSVSIAGGKATRLAVMGHVLGLPVPRGFVVTAFALNRFLQESGLSGPIASILEGVDVTDPVALEAAGETIGGMVRRSELPLSVSDAIQAAYSALEGRVRPGVRIAMRSSAVGEDSEASFAGQFVTELNVHPATLIDAYKSVVASKYSPRAILYRLRHGLDDEDTPMCVAGVEMIDARASGVLYTVDPSSPESGVMKISAILGLGEHLVSGEASPDDFFVDRSSLEILRREIRPKRSRLVGDDAGGLRLEDVPESQAVGASISDEMVSALARAGKLLEDHFRGPQDVEWAIDGSGALYLLQTRPLGIVEGGGGGAEPAVDCSGHPVLLQGGRVACPGAAAGTVVLADGKDLFNLPEDAILVARTASPDYAALVGRVRGIITDVGSVASHLASVVRELRVPALFDTGDATRILRDGDGITLVSGSASVYEGIIEGLASGAAEGGGRLQESPIHRRLRAALDGIAPLNLTEPNDPGFTPEGCRTLHDVVRFAHECIMKELFSLSEKADGAASVRLKTNIPLNLHCIDLGGGLKDMLTTCDDITANHLTSIPMKALWKGFTHPGITWAGTINFDTGNLMSLMASSATAEVGGEMPGGDSYAVLSRDYLNLSAKFGYHYANVDVFCGEDDDDVGQNHILLQFSGGVGSFAGRSMRIQFLSAVLGRLGFHPTVTGDLLEASFKGAGREVMEETLDQLGRLLASSRLLDMIIASPAQVEAMTELFFRGDYDFLSQNTGNQLPGFYTPEGDWRVVDAGKEGEMLLQDGSRRAGTIGSSLARFMGKVMGARYQGLLDNVKAYYYFPMAIARESSVEDAVVAVRVKLMAGRIDQAGGLAFGLRNVGSYFVLRINGLEDNLILFEYVNNRRFSRGVAPIEIATDRWYSIRVETSGSRIRGFLNGQCLIEYTAQWPVHGYVGLWTKADSVTGFKDLTVTPRRRGDSP